MMDISYPNAKINLSLFVTRKRPDAYHEIESLFLPIPFCDVLRFEPTQSATDQWCQDGLFCDGAVEDNLVMKALARMRTCFMIPPLSIHLTKNIPMGAGLGGGSADAAWMLKRLNAYFTAGLTENELQTMAADLGSDCAFFIRNKPALARGRGEQLVEIDIDLRDYVIALICPPFHVSTQEAYAQISPKPAPDNWLALHQSPSQWAKHWRNDFETVLVDKYPILADYIQCLYKRGAVYAAMTGSGSAFFALFEASQKNALQTLEGLPVHWLSPQL